MLAGMALLADAAQSTTYTGMLVEEFEPVLLYNIKIYLNLVGAAVGCDRRRGEDSV